MKILNSKFILSSVGVSVAGLYVTGYLDDAGYLLGGIYRGIRCGVTGTMIATRYLNVNK